MRLTSSERNPFTCRGKVYLQGRLFLASMVHPSNFFLLPASLAALFAALRTITNT